ncbi:probable bifunctional methylthioribulose-1-phosphate dehydratase/enolase-phosphatase E1 isoform X1 [Prosopis cineraria]|uniref:probable bifunctional methylthioribulose-1-phosphate dehydratase/enolase-phosphatase E1 isoform X1 n=1 Tax=Prosopis cineraria TaxID=364024 RepID=UPI00240ED0CE|nr:probable bifunctional methylthioribulose-1-phosphate dehydratase/enolase-phosphatase E1 isoform X1 [Prosopis cineraria]
MAAAAPAMALNGIKTGTASQGHLERTAAKETEVLISGFCRHFYNRRWVIGTAGSIAVKVHNVYIRKSQQLMVMSPSGGLSASSSKPCLRKTTKSSGCDSLFMKRALDLSCPSDGPIQRVRSSLGIGMEQNVSTKARKSEGEIDPFPHCVVLDIEGTTTPISFVTEVLFPYARANVGRHLSTTYDTPETQDDIKLLRSQVQNDLEQGIAGAVPIPSDDARKEEVIAALVANVEAMIKADRKITALKELQGHIWQTGFEGKELEAIVFDDVPKALEKWHALGKKVYIYSSGSRLAQRLIFGNTNYGDLRKYLCGFFDTKVGNKRETSSYVEIFESLGVDKPSNILFLTDVSQEATAAKSAGLEVVISVRPGNGPLPENHGFRTVNSFLEV